MNQPDAFGVRFHNDLSGSVVLALCHSDHSRRCEHPYYRDKIAVGEATEENISPDLETEWAVETPGGRLLRCVLLYWKYEPNHTPTVSFSSAPAWSRPCRRLSPSPTG
jgi:hypothetical protein